MGNKRKLKKFEELHGFANVFQNYDYADPDLYGKDGEVVQMKGKWASEHFGNDHPVTLELACGGGEYTLALAAKYPERNFIGVDIKGARIWKGATKALDQSLQNAAFLRTRIEKIADYFAAGEVSDIWITFPDPFLRDSKVNRRLTSPNFLMRYAKIITDNANLHLKTDDPDLYAFTLETMAAYPGAKLTLAVDDIYSGPLPLPELAFKTYYEEMHLAAGKTIKYVGFKIKAVDGNVK